MAEKQTFRQNNGPDYACFALRADETSVKGQVASISLYSEGDSMRQALRQVAGRAADQPSLFCP
jgi:hypothetical protein